jgi:hypothetical protein
MSSACFRGLPNLHAGHALLSCAVASRANLPATLGTRGCLCGRARAAGRPPLAMVRYPGPRAAVLRDLLLAATGWSRRGCRTARRARYTRGGYRCPCSHLRRWPLIHRDNRGAAVSATVRPPPGRAGSQLDLGPPPGATEHGAEPHRRVRPPACAGPPGRSRPPRTRSPLGACHLGPTRPSMRARGARPQVWARPGPRSPAPRPPRRPALPVGGTPERLAGFGAVGLVPQVVGVLVRERDLRPFSAIVVVVPRPLRSATKKVSQRKPWHCRLCLRIVDPYA